MSMIFVCFENERLWHGGMVVRGGGDLDDMVMVTNISCQSVIIICLPPVSSLSHSHLSHPTIHRCTEKTQHGIDFDFPGVVPLRDTLRKSPNDIIKH